jgi:hypothetical protein
MRYQGLARQKKSHSIPGLARVAGKKCSRPTHIHEYNIADTEAHGFFVVGHCRAAGELKEHDKVVCAIDANIPPCALDSMGIGTDLSRHKPADARGTHPAGKRLGVAFRVEPAAHLSDLISPRLAIQA